MLREASTHDGIVDLEWLVEGLEHARANEQTRLLDYLQGIADDVVFEMESTSRRA